MNLYIERLKPPLEFKDDPVHVCMLGDCFYHTVNGKSRFNRHLKIYHELKRDEYNMECNKFEIYVLNLIIKDKIKTPTKLKTISNECLSPRGIKRLKVNQTKLKLNTLKESYF